MRVGSSRRGPMRCGGRMRRASTRSATGGAGSSGRSITTRPRRWAGTSRRSTIAGRRWGDPAGTDDGLRYDRPKDRARRGAPARLGEPVHGQDIRERDQVLGFTDAPASVGEPECNGCAERFMQTLKEQCLYLHQFRDLEEARQVIGAFIERYNTEWIVERLGYRTPAQARRDALQEAA